MSKMLKKYQNQLRAKLSEAAVANRADVFVSLTTKGLPAAAAKWPDQFARMVEDVRLEFEISDKDLDEAYERAGIRPARAGPGFQCRTAPADGGACFSLSVAI
jgi:hypothetical protein